MPRRSTLRALDFLKVYGPAVLLTVAAFVVAYQFVDPAPPDRLVIAAGPPEGAYSRYAERYRQILADRGIDLEIRQTSGSVENLGLLVSGDADVAFVQGGIEGGASSAVLQGLGSLYYEPVWLFVREGRVPERLTELRGLRLAIGEPGSGTFALAKDLLRRNDLTDEVLIPVELGGAEAADALLAGDLDALMLVSGGDSPLVARLMKAPGVELMSFRRAQAYARLFPFLSKVRLSEGMIDMTANLPPADVDMVATAATLVQRDGLHPALVDLLMQALELEHGGEGWFAAKGRFPSPDFLAFPLSPAAERFYQHGPPFLQRYLPFWAATLVDRLKVMLLPLLVILLPLFKVMPPVYQWRMRSRIYRWYKALEDLEARAEMGLSGVERREALAELDRIESDVRKLQVPLSYAAQAFDLRLHVRLVRDVVRQAGQA